MGGPSDQLFFAKALQYYKRREVQEAILRHAEHREVSPRYGEGFGKRPDMLSYPQDILEFAKRKTTSFHVSEERWENPLSIKTGASRKEMNALRIGWDLVLDIDAKDWDISRLTAWLFIEALRKHGITSITVKFSGNKGWHVGVPFEAFPESMFDEETKKDILTKDLFPEMPRAIAGYLIDFMSKQENGMLTFENETVVFTSPTLRIPFTLQQFSEKTGKQVQELLETYCPVCNKVVAGEESYRLVCPTCQYRTENSFTKEEKSFVPVQDTICPKCKHYMEFFTTSNKTVCGHKSRYTKRFKITEIVQVDTILLASRHLYRMPYSLHEKSGLSSVVIPVDDVLTFDKKSADPKTVSFERIFLDTSATRVGEASDLALKAMRWQAAKTESTNRQQRPSEFDEVVEATTEEHFPPCIKNILNGLVDGKKRAMFALTNFLAINGWTPDMIERRLNEWNAKNPEPLREVNIKGHMHGVRAKRERILPPNCKSFYQELGVCKPDEFCSRSKNPAQYAVKHAKLAVIGAKRRKRPSSEEPVKVSDGKEKERAEETDETEE